MHIRPATSEDAQWLDAIALTSKAHWGYSREQMDNWRADLLTPPESILTQPTFVAETDGRIAGFAQLDSTIQPWALISLWVLPAYMGRGIGKALVSAAISAARSAGQSFITIDSDPNAERFYLACGAEVVSHEPAPIPGDAQRTRPQMRLHVPEMPAMSAQI